MKINLLRFLFFSLVFLFLIVRCSSKNNSTGTTGPQGPAGTNGTNGSNGSTGATGATGSQGPAGPTGPQGPPGPQGPAGPSLTGGIDGYLFFSYSGSDLNYLSVISGPISGVEVQIEGTSFVTNTDSNGYFTFSNVPQGTYALTFTKSGYGSERSNNIVVTGNGIYHRGAGTIGTIPAIPTVISVYKPYAGIVEITATTNSSVEVGIYFSTSSSGPWLCSQAWTNGSGQATVVMYPLISGQTYYYQLEAVNIASTWYFDQPQAVANPPDCYNGYSMNQQTAVSNRTSISSFVAP